MIVVPVTHDFVHLATVHTARLPLSLLDEVAEEGGAWRKRHMVNIAVQGLVHSEHELSHTHILSSGGASARFCLRYAIGCELDRVILYRPGYSELNTICDVDRFVANAKNPTLRPG